MFDNLYKKPGDPIRASDWNALLSLISETQSQPSLPINHRTVTPFSARTSIVGAGFSLRSITKVSSTYLAYFNPGAVHLLNRGSSTQRIIPTIDGRSMDTIPYPSITAVAGPLFLVLKTDSSQQVTSAVLTQNSTETGSKIQIGLFLTTGDTLRYYPSHTGDVIFNNQSGSSGGVTINQQYIGANVLHAAAEPTTEIKQRSIVGNAGSNPMGTIYGLTSVQQVGETVNAHSWISFVEPMTPGVEIYPTLQASQLENSQYGLISKPLIPGNGIQLTDEPGAGIVISATGGGGGGTGESYTAGDNITIDSQNKISWTGMPVWGYGDIAGSGDFGSPIGSAKVLYFDGFSTQVWPDGTLSVAFAIPVTDEVWDTSVKGFVFDQTDFVINMSESWPGFLHVKKRAGSGATTTGYTGQVVIPGADYDGAMSSHYREFDYENGLLKRVSNLTPNGYPPDYP